MKALETALGLLTNFERFGWFTRLLIISIIGSLIIWLFYSTRQKYTQRQSTPIILKDSGRVKPTIIQLGDHNTQNNNFN